MPENAYRTRHLHDHSLRSTSRRGSPELQRAKRLHPTWPICDVCRFPIDPAAGATHPACHPEQQPTNYGKE